MTNRRPDTQLCKMMWVRLMLVLTATATFCRAEEANKNNLEVRALWNLATMATKVIKCPLPVFPIPYGCWCGITLSKDPGDPIDDFDAACMVHDHCYDRLEEDKKCSNNINEYTANYKWHVDQDFKVVCEDNVTDKPCARGLCECDKAVIERLGELSAQKGCKSNYAKCHHDS